MKIILLILFVTTFIFGNPAKVNQIAKKLDQLIKSDTKNINYTKINYDPFYIKDKKIETLNVISKQSKANKKTVEKPVLTMIFNEKAFINSKWYKKNEKIDDYLIQEIFQDRVLLKKKNKTVILRLSNKSKKIYTVKEKVK